MRLLLLTINAFIKCSLIIYDSIRNIYLHVINVIKYHSMLIQSLPDKLIIQYNCHTSMCESSNNYSQPINGQLMHLVYTKICISINGWINIRYDTYNTIRTLVQVIIVHQLLNDSTGTAASSTEVASFAKENRYLWNLV